MSDKLNGPAGTGKSTPPGDSAAQHGTQGLLQLCVIVQKDQIGYGLTVSGDKPVHVQSVKEYGASARAGVKTGDRIYKVNGASVRNCDHTEVVNLIKAGSHVSLTLLRKPDKEQPRKTPSSPALLSVSSVKSGGSDRITNPIPADAHQEQLIAKEKADTVRRMYDEAVATENKLQQEYSKSKSHKTESKLQDAKKTTGAIRQQLDSLTTSADVKSISSRNSVCLGEVQSASSDNIHPTAVSMPASVDSPDSSIVRSPIHSTIGELTTTTSITTVCTSDEGEDDLTQQAYLRRSSGVESRNSVQLMRVSQNPGADIFSMDDDDFSPESQTVVKDHGPFMDFELLRNRRAHCSVFLSFLISNGDPAAMLFTLTSELYLLGTVREMKKWAYEIHSTFIVKDAPLDIKLDDAIVETIENTLKLNPERDDLWKHIFQKARLSASEEIRAQLADFRQKRELGLGNFFGDGELKEDIDKASELRIVEKTLRPHHDKFMGDAESSRSQAMSLSLTTVMKEWGVHKIDRQLSFAMKDINKTSFKTVLGGKFKTKQKDIKNHVFNQHVYSSTTFCDQCAGLVWGIGYQGYTCSNCEMNIHKECISNVDTCKKKKPKKPRNSKSYIKPNISKNPSTSSSTTVPEEGREAASAVNDEESPSRSVAKLKERFEVPAEAGATNGVKTSKSSVGRSESFHKKSDSVKSKDGRRAKSDVDKEGGEKIIISVINASRSSSSTSSLSNRSDSSSNERVNEFMKPASIDEEVDSDLEVEESMPQLDSVIRKDILRKMKPKEKKLHDVINELLYTEKSHVRNLKILDILFHRPMSRAEFCSKELVDLVFPDIKSLIAIHVQLNNDMKAKMKEDPLVSVKDVANILINRFDAEAGEKMKEVCALFCRNHSYALNALKDKRKRDAKLQELLTAAETNPMCRRLQFKDLMIGEVHRLTKYPLLIDSMCNHATSLSEEHRLLTRASRSSRNILAHVNQAVKDCENHHKLVALQKRLDTRPIQNSANPLVADYKNLNLQDYKLVSDGMLTWRMTANRVKQIDLHVVLLEEMLVLLQVGDDNKLVLKCQSQIATQGRDRDDSKFGHSPIITLNSMLVRQVATDKKAIYIINTSQLGPQIYDLVANSVEEKKRWFRYITEAADSQKKSIPSRRTPVNKSNLTLTEVNTDEPAAELESPDSVATAQLSSNVTTNNNVTAEYAEGWPDSPPPSYSQLLDSGAVTSSSTEQLASEKEGLAGKQTDNAAEVSVNDASQDDDGERDPKSLLLASISDTVLLKQLLSATATLNAAATLPAPQLPSPPASATAKGGSQLSLPGAEQALDSLSRRLNSLLEVMEERESDRARMQHQLQTAEQLLREAPKDMGDSRPNSFVSNSSSSASVSETPDSQINAMISIPVMPAVIKQTQTEPSHSALPNPLRTDSTTSAHSSAAESDSDDEGTVYADTKEDFNDDMKSTSQRPDSSLSDVSNTHTDNTLVSTENLSEDVVDIGMQNDSILTDDTATDVPDNVTDSVTDNIKSNATDSIADSIADGVDSNVIPHIEVSSASSTADSDSVTSDIENSNIDDIVVATEVVSNSTSVATDSELRAAADLVDEAMKAAIDIMKAESNGNDIANCNNVHVGCISDTDSGHAEESGAGAVDSIVDDIDDSDEADALSASSLD